MTLVTWLLIAAVVALLYTNRVLYFKFEKQKRLTECEHDEQAFVRDAGFRAGKDAALTEYWEVALWLRKKAGINATLEWTASPGPRHVFEELKKAMALEADADALERELERRGRLAGKSAPKKGRAS